MRDGLRSDTSAETAAVEQQYRRLVRRWYPRAWVGANGDAVIGTLLDVAEHQGRATLSATAKFSFASHGFAAHLRQALPAAVRDRVASVGVGTVVAYGTVTVSTSLSPIGWVHPHQLPSLLPFLLAWFLVAGTAFARNGWLRGAVVVLAVAITITITTSGAWWSGGLIGAAKDGDSWWLLVGYYGPAIAAPTVLLLGASASTFIGRPRLGPVAVSAAVVAVVVLGLMLVLTQGLQVYEPDWFWAPDWAHMNLAAPILGFLAIDAAIVILLLIRRRHYGALSIALAAAPWLIAWLVEISVNPTIGIPA